MWEHGGHAENEEGGILGAIYRTWIAIKEALTDQSETAILGAVVIGEKAALANYDMGI
ncbi:MAG: DUF2383 domain-containing protein [Flavobacterium sp.]|nr:MAG: DUF2383 domain-containing protein [Flavobacterium sp.]